MKCLLTSVFSKLNFNSCAGGVHYLEIIILVSVIVFDGTDGEESLDSEYLQDVEVMLKPGPMIAPGIVVDKFVDSKIAVEEITSEEGNDFSAEITTKATASSFSHSTYEILQDRDFTEDNFVNSLDTAFSDDCLQDEPELITNVNSIKETIEQSKHKPSSSCLTRIYGTSGNFTIKFEKDCEFLLRTPITDASVTVSCTSVDLPSCLSKKDTLIVNVMGDLNFEQNSFLYCGPGVTVQATSFHQILTFKVRRNQLNPNAISHCSFNSRRRRQLNLFNYLNFAENDVGPNFQPQCGKLGRNSKIVGGRRVTPGLFPWAAQLDISRKDGSQTACTGSLISNEFILTAAHCLKNAESVGVYLGGTDRNIFTGSEIVIQAGKYILHRKWSARKLTADIALVKMTHPIKFSEDVAPICLPRGKLLKESFDGRNAVAVGWGRLESRTKAPRKLYRVKLPFLSQDSCKRIYKRFYSPNTMVCTDSTVRTAICYGDSGGPLMYKRKDKVYQIGVASFSLSKTCGKSPDVFTKVSEYVEWIKSKIDYEDDDE